MPTENRRVATYLPKALDERLEAFKVERGLKDSPALIAILEEYFGVSQEVAHLSSSEYDDLSRRVDDLKTEISQFESRLFSELKGSLLAELRSELLDELRSEPPVLEPPLPSPGQLSFLEPKPGSSSELPGEPSEASSVNMDQPSSYLDSPLYQEVDQKTLIGSEPPSEPPSELSSETPDLTETKGGELSSEQNGKPLDGSVTWSGVELSKRLKKVSPPELSKQKDSSEDKFAEWSKERDPDGIAWKRVGKGKYVPIIDNHQDF